MLTSRPLPVECPAVVAPSSTQARRFRRYRNAFLAGINCIRTGPPGLEFSEVGKDLHKALAQTWLAVQPSGSAPAELDTANGWIDHRNSRDDTITYNSAALAHVRHAVQPLGSALAELVADDGWIDHRAPASSETASTEGWSQYRATVHGVGQSVIHSWHKCNSGNEAVVLGGLDTRSCDSALGSPRAVSSSTAPGALGTSAVMHTSENCVAVVETQGQSHYEDHGVVDDRQGFGEGGQLGEVASGSPEHPADDEGIVAGLFGDIDEGPVVIFDCSLDGFGDSSLLDRIYEIVAALCSGEVGVVVPLASITVSAQAEGISCSVACDIVKEWCEIGIMYRQFDSIGFRVQPF
jgi:hypothetical protein